METYQAQLKEAVEELAALQLELKTADRLLRRLAQSSDPSDEQKQELNETRSRASTLEQQLAEKHDEVQELRAEIGGLVALLEPRQGSEAGRMVTDHKSHRVRAIPSDIPLLDSSKPNFDLEQYLNQLNPKTMST
jgi:predicted nuclease with TOPRIM domain